ncbi:MAG: kelch repeat-containing protein, partial [Acidimicrobiales bacterium]|nr:kelch repeat-containing protein [Acidimicrobiales bacterium]
MNRRVFTGRTCGRRVRGLGSVACFGVVAVGFPAIVCAADSLPELEAGHDHSAQAIGLATPLHMSAPYRIDAVESLLGEEQAMESHAGAPLRGVSGCDGTWNLVLDSSPTNSDCICYDRRRRLTVVANSTETWEWDGVTWEHVDSGGTRGGTGAFVYDPIDKRCLYFGGQYNTELWSWDGASWTMVSNSPVPQRVYPAMAFDTGRNRLVVHGGYDSANTLYQDTWEWDPTTNAWTQTPTSPIGPLYAHRMVYDEARGQSVLHGGFYYENQGDSWAWDGTSWTEITPQGPARYVFSMAYDRRG